jgi:cholesterol transport system auxiliary component
MKVLLFIPIILLFLGCSVSKPVTEFRLNTNLPKIDIKSEKCLSKTIKVSQPFCEKSLETLQMNYMHGKNKMYEYTESSWADSPSNAIGYEVVKALREMDIFKSVQSSKSRSKAEYILETSINDFVQYFDEDLKESYASVVINFTIIDSKKDEVIATKKFQSTIKSSSLDAKGGVEALNKSLSEVLKESSIWFGEMCI